MSTDSWDRNDEEENPVSETIQVPLIFEMNLEPLEFDADQESTILVAWETIPNQKQPEVFNFSEPYSRFFRQFTDWLHLLENKATDFCSEKEPEMKGTETGLYQVFEALTSQRQEMKLYTKSGRQLQERLEVCIEETTKAVEMLQRFRKERPEIEQKITRSFWSGLIEIDESLQRTGKVLETIQKRMQFAQNKIETIAGNYCDKLSFWERFRKRKTIRQFTEYLIEQQKEESEQLLESFQQGFTMLLQRMENVLKKHNIKRFDPVGEPVDPETMQVVAVVESNTVPAGYVVDVLRFGYFQRNQLFRFADVRAATKPQEEIRSET